MQAGIDESVNKEILPSENWLKSFNSNCRQKNESIAADERGCEDLKLQFELKLNQALKEYWKSVHDRYDSKGGGNGWFGTLWC